MHCDSEYNHPRGEINFWLPFTDARGNNSIYVETQPEKGDFHCVELKYGQLFRFYGNMCRHFNELNDTGSTRVSIDFRIIPASMWDFSATSEAASVKSGLKFTIGGYYDIFDLSTL